jgi:hypothetical protein
MDVHGSEDQVKDASSAARERHVSVFLASGACASKSACGRRSLPRRPLDIRCRRCVAERGGDPFPTADRNQDPRSDADPRRTTPSRRPGCLPPLRSAVSVRARIAPYPNLPRRSLAHAAHTFSPGWGECLHGHCKHQSAVTRDPWHSRNKRLFYRREIDPFGSLVPGTDDPSAPFGSDDVARLRELIAPLVPTPAAAPRRLLRPRARGPMCRELHERVYA